MMVSNQAESLSLLKTLPQIHPVSDSLLVSISKCFSYLVSSSLGQIFPPSSFYPLLSNCHNNDSKTQVWPCVISPFISPRWSLVAYNICNPQQSKWGLLWGDSLPHCRLIYCSPHSMSRLEPPWAACFSRLLCLGGHLLLFLPSVPFPLLNTKPSHGLHWWTNG